MSERRNAGGGGRRVLHRSAAPLPRRDEALSEKWCRRALSGPNFGTPEHPLPIGQLLLTRMRYKGAARLAKKAPPAKRRRPIQDIVNGSSTGKQLRAPACTTTRPAGSWLASGTWHPNTSGRARSPASNPFRGPS
jgi:hypothetical protein